MVERSVDLLTKIIGLQDELVDFLRMQEGVGRGLFGYCILHSYTTAYLSTISLVTSNKWNVVSAPKAFSLLLSSSPPPSFSSFVLIVNYHSLHYFGTQLGQQRRKENCLESDKFIEVLIILCLILEKIIFFVFGL